jgi:hypothetical protein
MGLIHQIRCQCVRSGDAPLLICELSVLDHRLLDYAEDKHLVLHSQHDNWEAKLALHSLFFSYYSNSCSPSNLPSHVRVVMSTINHTTNSVSNNAGQVIGQNYGPNHFYYNLAPEDPLKKCLDALYGALLLQAMVGKHVRFVLDCWRSRQRQDDADGACH